MDPETTGATPSRAEEVAVLRTGEVELRGRILPASNLTFFGTVTLSGHSLACVYKPVSGERPLWDFPDGTLAAREVAAYEVSEALGWDIVPPTLLRDGPGGPGMVQAWREPDSTLDPVSIVPVGTSPEGYLHVLDAVDADDEPVALVHEDTRALRRMAVFDVLINNADRKGGHVLAMGDGRRHGVDHGVSFHVDNKLRTVLWGWSGQPLLAEDEAPVRELEAVLGSPNAPLVRTLIPLLSDQEIIALRRRCQALLAAGRMPQPSRTWPAIPWPAF